MTMNDPWACTRPSVEERVMRTTWIRERLHQADIDLVAAQVLERSADRSVNAPLATVLRERAHQRRRRATLLRSAAVRQY